MPEYHIAPDLLAFKQAPRIWAGVLTRSGRLWRSKSEVTSDFWRTLIQIAKGYRIGITAPDGRKLAVYVVEEGEDEPVAASKFRELLDAAWESVAHLEPEDYFPEQEKLVRLLAEAGHEEAKAAVEDL